MNRLIALSHSDYASVLQDDERRSSPREYDWVPFTEKCERVKREGTILQVGKKIGCGNFGELRLGKNLYNNEHVAIKLEPLKSKVERPVDGLVHCLSISGPSASSRVSILQASGSSRWGVTLPQSSKAKYSRGSSPSALLRSMWKVQRSRDGASRSLSRRSLRSLRETLLPQDCSHGCHAAGGFLFTLCIFPFHHCLFSVDLFQIRRIEYVHNKHLIYRDVKPENFLIGRFSTRKQHLLHIIDFGLAKEYIDCDTG